MEILILPQPEGDVVAWEIQLGEKDGFFTKANDGAIVYRNKYDDRDWIASPSLEQFLAAAFAWNHCGKSAMGKSEKEQLAAAKILRNELTGLGVLDGDPDSFWELLLEQREDGLL